jgi:hypothetical protein
VDGACACLVWGRTAARSRLACRQLPQVADLMYVRTPQTRGHPFPLGLMALSTCSAGQQNARERGTWWRGMLATCTQRRVCPLQGSSRGLTRARGFLVDRRVARSGFSGLGWLQSGQCCGRVGQQMQWAATHGRLGTRECGGAASILIPSIKGCSLNTIDRAVASRDSAGCMHSRTAHNSSSTPVMSTALH